MHAHVLLRLSGRQELGGVVNAAVEKAAAAMGLDPQAALAVTLAAEELFACHCRLSPGAVAEVLCRDGLYRVVLEMSFPLGPRPLNLLSRPGEAGEDPVSLGPVVLASRLADHLELSLSQALVRLCLSKHKPYPPLEELPPLPADRLPEPLVVSSPDPGQLRLLSALTCATYPPPVCMAQMCHPPKVVDMVASGEYSALVAAAAGGDVVGGVVWRWWRGRLVEFFGPYSFVPSAHERLCRQMIEAMERAVAGEGGLGLVCRFAPPQLPAADFEPLGSLRLVGPDGRASEHTAWFRRVGKAEGARVWVEEGIREFVEGNYARLALPRSLEPAPRLHPEEIGPYSVVGLRLVRGELVAVVVPLVPGRDLQQLLLEHCNILAREGFANIFCEVDLGSRQQAGCVGQVLGCGFSPRMLLPWAGQGDVVVMQWEGAGG